MLSIFPRDFDEIWDLIGSASKVFPAYSSTSTDVRTFAKTLPVLESVLDCINSVSYIVDLIRLVISYEIYETSLRPVS